MFQFLDYRHRLGSTQIVNIDDSPLLLYNSFEKKNHVTLQHGPICKIVRTTNEAACVRKTIFDLNL